MGKSWLALWPAVTVAKGEPVWGMQVKQGTTLYLCLEDSQLRIQNRLFDVTEDAPSNVHFCTESCILGDGLTEQIEQFLAEHPDTVFSKDRLFNRVWGTDACGDPSTVTVHIKHIRDKIEADPEHIQYIETVWGVGYRFRG